MDFLQYQITCILERVRDEGLPIMVACRELDRIKHLEYAALQAYIVRE